MEYKEMTKEMFDVLASCLDWKDKVCCECGEKVTRDNFGIIHADYVCCNNILCQIATFDKIEEDTQNKTSTEEGE